MNLEQITRKAADICITTGRYLKDESIKIKKEDIHEKGAHDYVTYVDKRSEEILVTELEGLLPGSGFITEEKFRPDSKKELTWVIDPLDGTTNFIHQVPIYSISVALMNENEVVAGVVHEVNSGESFYAWKSSKAYLNNSHIKVSNTGIIRDSFLATGFP